MHSDYTPDALLEGARKEDADRNRYDPTATPRKPDGHYGVLEDACAIVHSINSGEEFAIFEPRNQDGLCVVERLDWRVQNWTRTHDAKAEMAPVEAAIFLVCVEAVRLGKKASEEEKQ